MRSTNPDQENSRSHNSTYNGNPRSRQSGTRRETKNFPNVNNPEFDDGDYSVHLGNVYRDGGTSPRPQLEDRYVSNFEGLKGGKFRGGNFSTHMGDVYLPPPTPASMERSPAAAASGNFMPPTVDTGFSGHGDSIVEPRSRVPRRAKAPSAPAIDTDFSDHSDSVDVEPQVIRASRAAQSQAASENFRSSPVEASFSGHGDPIVEPRRRAPRRAIQRQAPLAPTVDTDFSDHSDSVDVEPQVIRASRAARSPASENFMSSPVDSAGFRSHGGSVVEPRRRAPPRAIQSQAPLIIGTDFSDHSDSVDVEPQITRASRPTQSQEPNNIPGTHLTPTVTSLATATDNLSARRPAGLNSRSPRADEPWAASTGPFSGRMNRLPGVPEPPSAASGNAADTAPGDETNTDSSTCVRTFWIGAENALKHANSQISAISNIFRRRNIQETEYIVLAGFDEELITSSRGYLEQIHVFVFAKLDAAAITGLLPEMGKIFSPFSSVLFNESLSYRVPVFKNNGRIYEYNQLVLDTTSKSPNNGFRSTASMPKPLTMLSEVPHTSSSNSPPSFPQPGASSYHGKGKGRDNSSLTDTAGSGSVAQGAGNRKINFEITSEVCRTEGDTDSAFQTIGVNGAISIQTIPLSDRSGTTQYPARHLKFLQLVFNTKQPTPEIGYRQSHIGVTIDSRVEIGQIARIESRHPMRTKAFDQEEKATSTTMKGEAISGGVAAALSMHPAVTANFNISANSGVNEAFERRKYNSSVTQHDHDGVIEWGFNIDDMNDQARGNHMGVERLPAVEFTFVNEANTLPTLPRRMDIVISSYWSFHLKSAPNPQDTRSARRLRQFFKSSRSSSDSTQRISYSNLLQVVALEMAPDALPSDYQYNTKVRIRSDGVGPQAPHDGGVKSIPGFATKRLQALKAWGKRSSTDGRGG